MKRALQAAQCCTGLIQQYFSPDHIDENIWSKVWHITLESILSQYKHLTNRQTELQQQYHALHYMQSHGKNKKAFQKNREEKMWDWKG